MLTSTPTSTLTSTLTSTHWGVYNVAVKDGVVTGVTPFERDPDPSPIGNSLPGAVQGPMRVRHPAVRKSYLEHGTSSASRRSTRR